MIERYGASEWNEHPFITISSSNQAHYDDIDVYLYANRVVLKAITEATSLDREMIIELVGVLTGYLEGMEDAG